MKIPIIGTGLSGLVGSRLTQLLGDKYDFSDLSLNTGVDITNYEQVKERIVLSEAKTIIHMAAKTDVDACEDDKILGEEGGCWQVNVEGTRNIVEAAKKPAKRIIFISTDFVFDGTKDVYAEDDAPNPVNWYGNSKYEAEKIIQQSSTSFLIVRLAYPYRAEYAPKNDFVRRILSVAKETKQIMALTDHVFTPTLIDDFVMALDLLIEKNLEGVFHLVGSQSLTPFQATRMIMDNFNLSAKEIPVTRDEYFKNRAFRPFKLALKNDKITKLGIKMSTFQEGLHKIIQQLEEGN